MTDRMENYVIAMGIRGARRWSQQWDRIYREAADLNLAELNAFRDQVMAPLLKMREAFGAKPITVSGMVQAVIGLLEECCVEEKLEAYQEYFLAVGE